MGAVKERMNLYITKSVMDELRRAIPARERTKFVEEVLARELRRRKLKEAIKASAGAWTDENHPELMTGEDIDRWIEEQRKLGSRDWSEEGGRMPDYILDTGVLIRHLRDHHDYSELVDRLTEEGDLLISAMTRLDIVRGMRDREQGATLELLDSVETLNVSSSVADQAGELIRFWKTHGTTIGDADAIIAASALQNSLTLVTTNPRHFPMSELVVLQVDEQGNLTSYR